MVDRPIIFSGPMVRALLAGRKTQTRRLASSPLRRCTAGDRLYVREGFTPFPPSDPERPRRWGIAFAATGGVDHFASAPAGYNPTLYSYERWTPSIHMPRWASRLTLVVEAVQVEPLQVISAEDVWAEGTCVAVDESERASFGAAPTEMRRMLVETIYGSAPQAFQWLWSSLHTEPGKRWEDNPAVVALTFRVLRGNIDEVGS